MPEIDDPLIPPPTAANEGAVYTKVVAGATQLFFREESNGDEIQLTGGAVTASVGEVTLPGGIGLKWGSTTGTNVNNVVYTGIGLTAFTTNTFSVASAFNDGPARGTFSNLSATGFRLTLQAVAGTIFWIVVGQ